MENIEKVDYEIDTDSYNNKYDFFMDKFKNITNDHNDSYFIEFLKKALEQESDNESGTSIDDNSGSDNVVSETEDNNETETENSETEDENSETEDENSETETESDNESQNNTENDDVLCECCDVNTFKPLSNQALTDHIFKLNHQILLMYKEIEHLNNRINQLEKNSN